MPVSAQINTKKAKSKSEILCDEMDSLIAKAQAQVKTYATIRDDLGIKPGLLKKVFSQKMGSEEDLQQTADEMRAWKTEVKSDLKATLNRKKNELKLARKNRKKNLREDLPTKTTTRKKKRRGGFI